MKKQERAAYLGLTEIEFGGFPFDNPILCTFCRYAGWSGGSAAENLYCKHPLYPVNEDCLDRICGDTGMGVDCWGFRPAFSIEVAADVVGIWLQGLEPEWDTVPRLVKVKALHE